MMSAARSQPLIIFLHLPKTAGTTLARIIDRQYDSSRILPLHESMFGNELSALSQNHLDRLRIVMGHLYFRAHTLAARPCTYISIPLSRSARVLSHYSSVQHD